jgi:hypothetical protein
MTRVDISIHIWMRLAVICIQSVRTVNRTVRLCDFADPAQGAGAGSCVGICGTTLSYLQNPRTTRSFVGQAWDEAMSDRLQTPYKCHFLQARHCLVACGSSVAPTISRGQGASATTLIPFVGRYGAQRG